jgi:hypothetical protein
MLRDNAPKVSSIPPLCAINHRMHPSDRARETVSGIFPLLARERQLIDLSRQARACAGSTDDLRPSRAYLPANDMRPLLADSVAKVGRKDPPRNVRSGTRAALNLPCHVNAADDSMFRVS